MTSKKLLRGATGGLVTSLLLMGALDASAQLTLVPGGPACTDFNGFEANGSAVSYVQCGGAFQGNNANQDVVGWLDTFWNLDASAAGTTDPSESAGVFSVQFNDGATAGTLNFTGLQGVFVLALKAANQFSLYQFDTGGDTWTTLTYGTGGTATNPGNGSLQALSHGTVYLASTTSTVPEPGTVVLLLTGLASLGFVGWRRRAAGATA